MSIDWSDPSAMVSQHFSVKECTYLPSWNCYHSPSDEEKVNIINMAQKMDKVRDVLGKPINVHVWIRPAVLNCPSFDPSTVVTDTDKKKEALANLDYNVYVGGASHSAHVLGKAVDYDCGENCDITRLTLESQLEILGLRMERGPGDSWIHNDDQPVSPGGNHYFWP
jgi:hypothetical protein